MLYFDIENFHKDVNLQNKKLSSNNDNNKNSNDN